MEGNWYEVAGYTAYTSGKALRADWAAGKDFRIVSGPPGSDGMRISIRSLAGTPATIHGRFRADLSGLVLLQKGA